MPRRNVIQLSRRHKAVLYAITFALFGTGAAWAWFHYFGKAEGEFGPVIHPAEPWMLKAHGAAAMGILVMLGTLLPIHVKRGWQARRNRSSGGGLLAVFGILTFTGYGLYYAGGEKLREWTSLIHLWLGLALPITIALHVWLGHRTRRALRIERTDFPTNPTDQHHAHP